MLPSFPIGAILLALVAGSPTPTGRGPLEVPSPAAWEAAMTEAEIRRAQGRYDLALEAYSRALKEAQRLGWKDLRLAQTIDDLASVHQLEGRWADAEALYRRSLRLLQELLGMEQPRVATTLHNLGVVCLRRGGLEEADGLLRRALVIWEKHLSPGCSEAITTRDALEEVQRRKSSTAGSPAD